VAAVGLAALLVALLLASGCQPARLRAPVLWWDAGSSEHHRNVQVPDPSVLYAEGSYWSFGTALAGVHGRIGRSADLYEWTEHGTLLRSDPTWAQPFPHGNVWAPTVVRIAGRYVMYFSSPHWQTPTGRPGWCLGYATSSTPGGPYTPSTSPMVCQVVGNGSTAGLTSAAPGAGRGLIDPQVFLAPDGAAYLHFKLLDDPRQLWGARLNSNGTGFSGQGHAMVSLGAGERTWEYASGPGHTVLENPAMAFNGAASSTGYPYYLFYSGNDWQTASYATGVAACRGPLGPCVRATANEPWMASRGAERGPGGLSFFRTAANTMWVAYHAWMPGQPISNNLRRLHVEPFAFQGLNAVLLSRPPTGSFTAAADGGLARFSGRADDPDTGARVVVSITEGSTVVAQARADAHGSWRGSLRPSTLGSHRYCARIGDDHGLAAVSLGCRTVTLTDTSPTTSTTATTVPPTSFSDVPGTHRYAEDIEWAAAEGIAVGYPDGTFRPSAPVRRDSMSAFMARLAGIVLSPPTEAPFADVPVDHPFAAEIRWMADAGISTGYADGTYRPSATVSRQALSGFVYRMAGEPAFTPPATPTYVDVGADHPFALQIEWMAAEGVSPAPATGSFSPGRTTDRGEVVAALHDVAAGPGVHPGP
jgi:hypothetical protein